MPLPLVWLGAGLTAIYAANKLSEKAQKYQGEVQHFPGESDVYVEPADGAIICCGVYEFFDHSGIFVEDSVIELHGSGLIKSVSYDRFLGDRSGEKAFVACDAQYRPLCDPDIVHKAVSRLYEYSEYDLINNNCHKFVWDCLSPYGERVTTFADLNRVLSNYFGSAIHWQPVRRF
ncbi:hypothetical protein EYS14_02515 [Alteromonadaceae bacterium M269]|nr:hypothetical protein EYS14_02515 [Alteromonadaceae bacterium M269]